MPPREGNILLAGYFDDLIKLSEIFREYFDNIFKIAKIFNSLGFVIHPGNSTFIPSQVIEYLGSIINSVTMAVSLTELKQKSLTDTAQKKKFSIKDLAGS